MAEIKSTLGDLLVARYSELYRELDKLEYPAVLSFWEPGPPPSFAQRIRRRIADLRERVGYRVGSAIAGRNLDDY